MQKHRISPFYVLAPGLLVAVGFPPFGLTPAVFVFFAVLWWAEDQLTRAGRWKGVLLHWLPFLIWNSLCTWWIAYASPAGAAFAILTNSLLMLGAYSFGLFLKKQLPVLDWWPVIFAWLTFEQLQYHWELAWPWLNLGNVFGLRPQWVQWYEFTGVPGGTFWILLVNWLVLKVWNSRSRKAWILGLVAALAVPLSWSYWRYYQDTEPGKNAEVVLLQANFDPYSEKGRLPYPQEVDRYLQLAGELLSDTTDFLILPEASFSNLRMNGLEKSLSLERLQTFLQQHPNTTVVAGATGYAWVSQAEGPEFELYNAAILLTQDSIARQFHQKSKLVPGSEFFPFENFLWFLRPFFSKFNISMEGFARGSAPTVFRVGATGVGPLICYESLFGTYTAQSVRKGAAALFLVTEDGWWRNSPGYQQHLAFGRLRAIETRRSIARAANTGISCLIDQKGAISKATAYQIRTGIRGNISLERSITFYVRYGDWVGWSAAIALLFCSLWALARRLSW